MSEIRLVRCEQRGKRQSISVRFIDGAERSFELAIPGEHNALNATAALIACMVNDFDLDAVSALMPGFMGARRRQEVRYDGAVTLIDDFAHHPTAVRETIRAIRALYPGRRLWAVFEPRSNTSRRKVFQNEYAAAFEGAWGGAVGRVWATCEVVWCLGFEDHEMGFDDDVVVHGGVPCVGDDEREWGGEVACVGVECEVHFADDGAWGAACFEGLGADSGVEGDWDGSGEDWRGGTEDGEDAGGGGGDVDDRG
jgi:hypothetical protein